MDGAFVDAQGQNRFAEDVNARDDLPANIYVPTLETYGGVARTLPFGTAAGDQVCLTGAGCPTPSVNRTPANDTYNLFPTPIDRNVARVNRAHFFRRALKLVNGGRGNLPANGSQGLTAASENQVYVQGNYNACAKERGMRRRIPETALRPPVRAVSASADQSGSRPRFLCGDRRLGHVLSNAFSDIRTF